MHDVGPFREEEMHYSNVARSDGIAENGLVQVWTVVDICSAVDKPFHEFHIVDGVATVKFSLVSMQSYGSNAKMPTITVELNRGRY